MLVVHGAPGFLAVRSISPRLRLSFVCVLSAIALLATLPVPAATSDLRVAIYSGTGAESDKILAMFRAVQAAGHAPLAITTSDILNGRLNTDEFDVFVIPSGEDGKRCCAGKYSDIDSLDKLATKNAMRAYLESGGGIVAIEAGAFFASKNGGTLDIYPANYQWTEPAPGKRTLEIVDPAFGSGTQEAWMSYGGGYFDVAAGTTTVAVDDQGLPVVVHAPHGAGRVILSSFSLELRGDSELDWTVWDNWAMGGVHQNSAGAWELLGRMIGWAYNGDPSAPSLFRFDNPSGHRVAILASHTSDGGAWPGLLPGVARSIENSGHVPLAIRFEEIITGRLIAENFRALTVPGGYSYGYKVGLDGHEQRIRDFIDAGGGYYGICAGSFYTAETLTWEGRDYPYALAIYKGPIIGPIDDIAPWPEYFPTPLDISGDPVIGDLGSIRQMYYGGGYHGIPDPAVQGSVVHTAGTFAYGGSANGLSAVVRYNYGNGRVFLVTTHPESRAGSEVDWMFWDDYEYDSTTPVSNADNPWLLVNAAFNNWITGPPPTLLCTDPPDDDGDGMADHCDCAPTDPTAHAIPPEVLLLAVGEDRETLTWESAAPVSGPGTLHDVIRGRIGEWPVGSGAGESCFANGLAGSTTIDADTPAPGAGFWYLVRARNACGAGTCGESSADGERPGSVCS